jgi:hypothetical protein
MSGIIRFEIEEQTRTMTKYHGGEVAEPAGRLG